MVYRLIHMLDGLQRTMEERLMLAEQELVVVHLNNGIDSIRTRTTRLENLLTNDGSEDK